MNQAVKHITGSIIVSFILVVGVASAFGVYYGWLDDVMILNLYKGTFSTKGFHTEELMNFVSNGLVILYNKSPDIPWYGIFLILTTYLAILFLTSYLLLFLRLKFARKLGLLFSFIVLFILLADSIVLLNFTRSSALLASGSVIWIWHNFKIKKYIHSIPFMATLWLALVMRTETTFIIILSVAIFSLIESGFNRVLFPLFLKAYAAIFVLVGIHLLSLQVTKSEEFSLQRKIWPYIYNVVDFRRMDRQSNSNISKEDSIKLIAIESYFFFDTTQVNRSFLERFGGKSIFKNRSLENIAWSIKYEYRRSTMRRESVESGWSFNNKFCFLCLIVVGLLIVALWLYSERQLKGAVLARLTLSSASIFIFILLVVGFTKYEDRVFSPLLSILVILILSTLLKQLANSKKEILLTFFVACLSFIMLLGISRIVSLYRISVEKEKEYQTKQEYINELNTRFTGKVFFHDYWSSWIIHGKPLRESKLSKANQHLVYGDLPYHELQYHRNYISKTYCNHQSFVDFYDCVLDSENVFFVMNDWRVRILEDYFKILYNRGFSFQEISSDSRLNDIELNFIWAKYKYGYYQLKRSH